MSDEDVKKIWRTLHLKFTLPGADSEQLSSLMRSAAPFFQMFGNANFRLLQNADDPTKFIQVIEYETHEAFELNRQSLASDMRFPGLPSGVARHASRRARDRCLSGSVIFPGHGTAAAIG